MESLSFGSCIRESWCDGARFVRRNPLTVIATIVVLFGCSAAALAVRDTIGSASSQLTSALVNFVLSLVRVIVTIMLPIQVMRYVMLDEQESHANWLFGKIFWRYMKVGVLLIIGCMLIVAIVFGSGFLLVRFSGLRLPRTGFAWVIGGVIAFCLIAILWTRVSLMFCHVSIGRRAGWRASWNDTRGHVWRIALSHLLTVLPIQACVIVVVVAYAFLGASESQALPYLAVAGQALSFPATLIVGATCSSWLYKRLANVLLDQR